MRSPQDGTLVFTAGSIVHFLDLNTMTTSYLPSVGGNEIGCIEVQTDLKLIAVCEKGVFPNVFIYEYPSLNLKRVLRNGTERAYSAVNFSGDGEKLATVGSFPDYMLTVWDWNRENIILRTKAFSQEVYRVSFSPRLISEMPVITWKPSSAGYASAMSSLAASFLSVSSRSSQSTTPSS